MIFDVRIGDRSSPLMPPANNYGVCLKKKNSNKDLLTSVRNWLKIDSYQGLLETCLRESYRPNPMHQRRYPILNGLLVKAGTSGIKTIRLHAFVMCNLSKSILHCFTVFLALREIQTEWQTGQTKRPLRPRKWVWRLGALQFCSTK